jgi:hypothetical protein
MNKLTCLVVLAILAMGAMGSFARTGDSPQTSHAPASTLRVTYYFLPG